MKPVTAAMKMYDFAMNQILKLQGIFTVLFENGYLLLIVLALSGILIYYLLQISIRIKMGLKVFESFNEKKQINKKKNYNKPGNLR